MKKDIRAHKRSIVKNYITGPVKAARDRVIGSGRNALSRIVERVKSANAKFRTMGNTAYTRLADSAEKQTRGHLACSYSVDKTMVQGLEEKRQLLMERYTKKATIKMAKENLRNARKGLEMTTERPPLTERQAKKILEIDSQIRDYKEEMADIKREFDLSRERSLANIKGAMELREANNMKESKSLNKAYQDAGRDIYEVVEGKEDANEEITPVQIEETVEQPEREDRIMKDANLSVNDQDLDIARMDVDEAMEVATKVSETRKIEITSNETTKETKVTEKDEVERTIGD